LKLETCKGGGGKGYPLKRFQQIVHKNADFLATPKYPLKRLFQPKFLSLETLVSTVAKDPKEKT
jgi:hypothetical protein